MTMTGNRGRIAIVGVVGLIFGVLLGIPFQQSVDAQQPGSGRKAIRPQKAPNTGLPLSPGILAGNTLYLSGHTGRDPVTAKDRKSTRLNSSHTVISYAVFCLKKKK